MSAADPFKVLPLRLIGFSFGLAQVARYKFSAKSTNVLVYMGCIFVIAHVMHAAMIKRSPPDVLDAILFEIINTVMIPPVAVYFLCGIVDESITNWNLPCTVKQWTTVISGLLLMALFHCYVEPLTQHFINDSVASYKAAEGFLWGLIK